MKWFPWRQPKEPEASQTVRVMNSAGDVGEFRSLNDPAILDFIRNGRVNANDVFTNAALLRCLLLISESIAMLPLNVMESGDEKRIAKEHPLYRLLKKRPNKFQTAYEFKRLMQLNVLRSGNAYAVVVRSGHRIVNLVPLNPDHVQVKQHDDFSVTYHVRRKDGTQVVYAQHEILHLKDFSFDGITGVSRLKRAERALGIAFDAENSIKEYFADGVQAKGALVFDTELSDESYKNIKGSMDQHYSGTKGSGKFMILEQGAKPVVFGETRTDNHLDHRNHQIEEIARIFGVPRPLLMMDDTSWGSGIEQLGIYFVQYALQPWFTCWEQAIELSLFTEQESDRFYSKFNERALLRGTLNDQANFFAKALGSGGHAAWYTANEVRELQDMPRMDSEAADRLQETTSSQGNTDESTKTA